MGSPKVGNTEVAQAEEVVTPAVARSASQDGSSSTAAQNEVRARMRGIRSTYNRFATENGGTSSKLG